MLLAVRVVAGELRVRFHGWDALWSLRREVRIPVDHITSVRVHRPDSLWSGWWRLVLQVPDPNALALTLTTAAPTALRATHARATLGTPGL